MKVVIKLFLQYVPWIYAACALAALWTLRMVILARMERRRTIFPLVKETARNKVRRGYWLALLLALLLGATYWSSIQASQFVPTGKFSFFSSATATPVLVATPTSLPSSWTPTPIPTVTPTPTITPTPAPPPAPPTPQVRLHCAYSGAVIISPAPNAVIRGVVPIVGTARHPNFQYYKLELGIGTNPKKWSYIGGKKQQVVRGQLGVFNGRSVPAGVYTIRLMVVDNTGNYPPPCRVTVRVVH